MIEVKNLSKFYGPTRAVEDVSFTVGKGEILGLLGPNGAGKTTIMRMLTGFFQPTSGTAKVAGYDVVLDTMEVKKKIGYLQEVLPLYHEMTVLSYLRFVAELKGVAKKDMKKQVNQALELTRTAEVQGRIVGRLSRGFKQRVGLAQALLNEPQVLILDEPTIGLDPKQIIEIRELIKKMAGERTVILSSHILPEVSMTCNKVVIIDGGHIIAEDTQEGLIARVEGGGNVAVKLKGKNPLKDVAAAFEAIKGAKDVKVKAEGGTTVVEVSRTGVKDIREDIFRTAVKNDWVIIEMKGATMSLEQVFLKLTTKEEQS